MTANDWNSQMVAVTIGSNDQLIGERMPPADFFIAKHDFMFCSQYQLNMLCWMYLCCVEHMELKSQGYSRMTVTSTMEEERARLGIDL